MFDPAMEPTVKMESNGKFDAWNPDDNGAGVSAGIIQFNQRRGLLFELVEEIARREPAIFKAKLGKESNLFLDRQLFKKLNLNSPEIKKWLKSLLITPAGRESQIRLAEFHFLRPVINALSARGLQESTVLKALLFDVCVQMGQSKMLRTLYLAENSIIGETTEGRLAKAIVAFADGMTPGRRTGIYEAIYQKP